MGPYTVALAPCASHGAFTRTWPLRATFVTNRRVLIVGAGIAGPTLAYWLLRRGFIPTLVERAPAPRTGGYMIDFWGVGYDVADRMALVPTLHDIGYHVHELRVVNAHGRRIARLDTTAFQSATQGRFVSIMRSDLASAIYKSVASDVETIFGDTVTAVFDGPSDALVTFEHAPPRAFDLVVGADGLHSLIRRLMIGEREGDVTELGYYTAAFTADRYRRRDEDAYVSFTAPRRQAARYALRGGRSAFFFVFTSQNAVPLGAARERDQRAALHRAFAGLGWECDEMLATMDIATDFYFDVVAQVRLATWFRGRTALIGDAAYCPSLLAGQGAAFAMTGAYVLAHELQAAAGDHASAFAAYQRKLKPFMDAKQRSAASYRWWFAPRTATGLWLRNRAIGLLALPGVGPLLVRRSLGDRFTLPTQT